LYKLKKKLDIWKLPDILIINLKRFQFTKYQREKIESFVDVPLQLNMKNYCLSSKINTNLEYNYDLYGVSNHYGGLAGGHYTAYCKVGNKWFEFDDSRTHEMPSENVVTSAGYVWFFINKNCKRTANVIGKIFPTEAEVEEEKKLKKLAEEKEEERKRIKLEEEKKEKIITTTTRRRRRKK